MTRLLLLRHAAHDLAGRALAGRLPGLGLNALGRQQAQALVEPLLRQSVQVVCASPQQRARETALPLANRLGVEVAVAPEFDEIDFGEWTGQEFGQVRDRHPGLWDGWVHRRSQATPPGGEPFARVAERVQAGVQRLAREHPDEVVLVASHADVIKATLATHLGLSLDRLEGFEIACGSLSVLEVGAQGSQVKLVNGVYF
ncbi:histidine phosphatase family protein [Ramlibacter tataouinensis]|uniref:Phosphoglycerate mutase n=1 Tax=Ramlibacter tataouinensis (strain ATCC BAA-407 / DSM 14655 / LMG 21543 / TTB310) TaxID=365046 RepID=F5Y5K2_RAMTT|nr:histidine phosphatase family protein [Ramlibacter tataouinensis]AEG92698.1 conserved hypothetical protein [Ramlibacter tataouinensis TTB310]